MSAEVLTFPDIARRPDPAPAASPDAPEVWARPAAERGAFHLGLTGDQVAVVHGGEGVFTPQPMAAMGVGTGSPARCRW